MADLSKSIFTSKRFWLNVAGLALEAGNAYAQTVPGGAIATGIAVANIVARRYMPDQGDVHVVTPHLVEP